VGSVWAGNFVWVGIHYTRNDYGSDTVLWFLRLDDDWDLLSARFNQPKHRQIGPGPGHQAGDEGTGPATRQPAKKKRFVMQIV
jgi:hypothetical protein